MALCRLGGLLTRVGSVLRQAPEAIALAPQPSLLPQRKVSL
jgi:hypothetical protein